MPGSSKLLYNELGVTLSIDPEAQRVRDWRHKLQKAFLSNKELKDEDIPGVQNLFISVENYEMNVPYLSFSKIGKVMRHIAALPAEKVPRDKEFKFRERANVLVDRWHKMVKSNGANGGNSGGGANGVSMFAVPPAEGAPQGATAPRANGTTEEGRATAEDDLSAFANLSMA